MAKKKSEREIARKYVFEGMELLPDALTPFVEDRLKSILNGDWREKIVERLKTVRNYRNGRIGWDQVALFDAMVDWVWNDNFSAVLGPAERKAADELISARNDTLGGRRTILWKTAKDLANNTRNDLAHNGEFSYDDAARALNDMRLLAEAAGSDKAAAQLGEMCKAIPSESITVFDRNFNGFPFGAVDFGYDEGKKILSLAMKGLRENHKLRSELGIDRRHPGRRGNIRNDGGVVWNVLVFKAAGDWEKFPHLTLGVGNEYVSAMTTLPTKAPKGYWERLAKRDRQGFRCMVEGVLEKMRPMLKDCPGMEPRLRVRQRRQSHDTKRTLMDTYIDVDLDTRNQPQWIDAIFDAVKNKKSNTNLELQIGAKFPYRPYIAEANALESMAKSWIACKPYIAALFGLEYIQGQPLNFRGSP